MDIDSLEISGDQETILKKLNSTYFHLTNISLNVSDTIEEPAAFRATPVLRHGVATNVCLIVAYFVVFILALLNNSLVVSVVMRNPQMKSVTNIFLANLAVADLVVTIIVLPITLLSNIFYGK